jgi:DtxR family transcriptional regulator, Mn-dependent transcriptional regulator
VSDFASLKPIIKMLTQTEENYIKTIYLLSHQGKNKVSNTALAAALGNNPASVVDMLKKLKNKKLIEYDKSRGAELNMASIKTAVDTVRKHRLWEMFLQEKLGYTWDEVHELAEQLEHVQNEKLADRLDTFLGHPRFDPHGEPIPTSEGILPSFSIKTIFDLNLDETSQVISVKDTSKSFLQYLRKLNIGIGSIVKVTEIFEFDGSITILINGSEKATISEKFAMNVFVN